MEDVHCHPKQVLCLTTEKLESWVWRPPKTSMCVSSYCVGWDLVMDQSSIRGRRLTKWL